MGWAPLPGNIPLDGTSTNDTAPAATTAAPDPAPASAPAAAPAGFAPLPASVPLDGASAAPQSAPAEQAAPDGSGFTDEQKQAILDYLPKALKASDPVSDLALFANQVSGGKASLGNAKAIIDHMKGGGSVQDFGWAPPTYEKPAPAAPANPLTMDNVRKTVGDALFNLIAPGFGQQLRESAEAPARAAIAHTANSVAMDYGPEVGGLIDTILHGGHLDNNVAHERAILQGESDGHPVASAAGELAGAGLTGALGGAAADALNLSKTARAAQIVGEGATYGSGAAGPGNRGTGAAIGAVLAPAAALAAKGAAAVPGLVQGVTQTALGGSPSIARRIIAKAIAADANTPEGVGGDIAAAQANGVPMALADTGENVRGLLAAASRSSGMARTVARDAIEERQSGLADRVTSAIQRDLGPVANVHDVADQLMTKAQTDAAPLYDSFYKSAPADSPAINSMLQRPSMQKALQNAYRIAKEEGRDPEAIGLHLDADGNVVPGPGISEEELAKAREGQFTPVDHSADEQDLLRVRTLTTRGGGKVQVRGPIDMTQSLRQMGGVKDAGGDLAHLGIDNAPRRQLYGGNEQFLGNLVDNERGMGLDDATEKLWEEGYFPEFKDGDRPGIQDLLDRLSDEHDGRARYFHPDDYEEVQRYNDARYQRTKAEEAANNGSPLTHDNSISAEEPPPAPALSPPTAKLLTPQSLDYIKRGMDDVVEGYRDPTTGKLNLDTEGRAINNTLRSYLGTVDSIYPDYAAARAAYAGPVKGVAALNLGRKFIGMNADDIEARMRDLSPFEKDMAALGARRQMAEIVSSKGDTADIVNALVGSGKKRAMLARLFGDRKNFQRFVDTLGQEREGWRTFKQGLLGSPTAANLSDDHALQAATMTADIVTHGIPIATAVGKAVKLLGSKVGQKTQEDIAAMLSNTDPAAVRKLAAELRAKAQQRGINVPMLRPAIRGSGNAAAIAGQQLQ